MPRRRSLNRKLYDLFLYTVLFQLFGMISFLAPVLPQWVGCHHPGDPSQCEWHPLLCPSQCPAIFTAHYTSMVPFIRAAAAAVVCTLNHSESIKESFFRASKFFWLPSAVDLKIQTSSFATIFLNQLGGKERRTWLFVSPSLVLGQSLTMFTYTDLFKKKKNSFSRKIDLCPSFTRTWESLLLLITND